MKPLLIAAVLSGVAGAPALADGWTGHDKRLHAQAGALVGFAAMLGTQDVKTACALATGVGAAKELWDMGHRHTNTPSFKDFAVTAIAGCLVAKGTGLVMTPSHITYTWRF